MNLSFHFNLKLNTIEEIKELYKNFIIDKPEYNVLDNNHIINHCFLPKSLLEKKGIPLDVPNFFNEIGKDVVCWYNCTSSKLNDDRKAMIRNIKMSNGTCIFLGKLTKPMELELKLAEEFECNIIKLD